MSVANACSEEMFSALILYLTDALMTPSAAPILRAVILYWTDSALSAMQIRYS